jgi:DNA-binding NarL/FixJ family response regulator
MTDVLIVSQLATIRAGLAAVLGESGDLRVVGEARSLEAAGVPDLLTQIDVVLLDAASIDTIEQTVTLLAGPGPVGPSLVILGSGGAASRLALAAPTFPWGFLGRDAAPDRIIAAVRAVAAGFVVLDHDMAAEALASPRTAAPLPLADTLDDLTAREHEVLTLVAVGLTNKAIAQRLGISDHTVKFHVAAVLAKLGAESRTEAVHLAVRRGLLSL